MSGRGDGAVGCIGVCNVKDIGLFKDRRGGKRPSVVPISATNFPSMRFKGGMSVEEHRKLDERLREKRNQRPLPIRSDIPVKRMRIRRDRAKLASSSGETESADVRLKLQEESDGNEEDNSGPQVTKILYVICRILFVIIGVGVLIYASVILISLIPSDALYKSLNKTYEPVKPVKLTLREWEEKRSQENQI